MVPYDTTIAYMYIGYVAILPLNLYIYRTNLDKQHRLQLPFHSLRKNVGICGNIYLFRGHVALYMLAVLRRNVKQTFSELEYY
jgi:hypothetical protein